MQISVCWLPAVFQFLVWLESRGYAAGSRCRVAFTPDRIPTPTSTIAHATIQCPGMCIKCAPYIRPLIKMANPIA
jgi:hypothetical protein